MPGLACDVECGESQVEPLTSASRPSLIQTAGRAPRRGKYKPHLALISAPPSVLSTGTLIRHQNRWGRVFKRTGDIVFLWPYSASVHRCCCFGGLVKLIRQACLPSSDGWAGYQRFGCIKFRTMRADADAVLARVLEADSSLRAEFERDFKLKSDPRITPVGDSSAARALMSYRSS